MMRGSEKLTGRSGPEKESCSHSSTSESATLDQRMGVQDERAANSKTKGGNNTRSHKPGGGGSKEGWGGRGTGRLRSMFCRENEIPSEGTSRGGQQTGWTASGHLQVKRVRSPSAKHGVFMEKEKENFHLGPRS